MWLIVLCLLFLSLVGFSVAVYIWEESSVDGTKTVPVQRIPGQEPQPEAPDRLLEIF